MGGRETNGGPYLKVGERIDCGSDVALEVVLMTAVLGRLSAELGHSG